MKKVILSTLFSLFAVLAVFAQNTNTLRVADDSSSGTYKKMLGELVSVCSTEDFTIQEVAVSGGAPGNLDALYNNKADAAFLHSDVFIANAQADPSYNRFKTLVALWPEPIHILALRASKTKKNVFQTVTFNSLTDVAGFTVGAAGGGVFTARLLQGQGQGGFTVQEYPTGADVIKALDNGEIAVAIFVGAAPLPNLEKLNKANYKLIPIGDSIANRVVGVYRPTKITYNGLTNGPVSTLASVATLLTKTFQTPAKVKAQAALRACFVQHLAELQDSFSPNWQTVQPNDEGTLNNYLNLPTTATTTRKR